MSQTNNSKEKEGKIDKQENKGCLKTLFWFTGIPLIIAVVGFLADISDAIQLLPEKQQEKIKGLFSDDLPPTFSSTKSNDTLYVLVSNFTDIALGEEGNRKNQCFSKALTALLETIANKRNLPLEIKYNGNKSHFTKAQAIEFGALNNADIIFWGKVRNVTNNCTSKRIELRVDEVKRLATISNDFDISFIELIEDTEISGYDIEDGLIFLGQNKIYHWLQHFVNLKIGLNNLSAFIIPADLSNAEKIKWHKVKSDIYLNMDSPNSKSNAIQEFESILTLAPNNKDALTKVPELLLDLNEPEKAFSYFEKGILKNPKNSSLYYQYSSALYYEGKYDEAELQVKKAILLDSTQSHYYRLRGHIYYSKGQLKESIDWYSYAINKEEYAAYYFFRASSYLELENYQVALEDINKAISKKRNYEYYKLKGSILYNLDKFEGAKGAFSDAISINPKQAELFNWRGLCNYALGLYNDEINDYSKAIAIDESNPNYFWNRGDSYLEIDSIERAIKDFDECLRLDTNYIKAYESRGRAYLLSEKFEDAIFDFNKKISFDTSSAKAFNYRGLAKIKSGNAELAISDFDMALSLDSSMILTIFNNKGFAKINMKKYSEALEEINKAFDMRDTIKNPYLYKNKGLALMGLKRYKKAEEAFSKAIILGLDSNEYIKYRLNSRLKNGSFIGAYIDFIRIRNTIGKIFWITISIFLLIVSGFGIFKLNKWIIKKYIKKKAGENKA